MRRSHSTGGVLIAKELQIDEVVMYCIVAINPNVPITFSGRQMLPGPSDHVFGMPDASWTFRTHPSSVASPFRADSLTVVRLDVGFRLTGQHHQAGLVVARNPLNNDRPTPSQAPWIHAGAFAASSLLVRVYGMNIDTFGWILTLFWFRFPSSAARRAG